MERWVGRVAIVTGASAVIGADIARLLAENGMRVVGVARRVHRVQVRDYTESFEMDYIKLNFTEFDTTKLCNLMHLNVIALCLFTRELVKDMRERGVDDGHIFHIGSVAGTRITNCTGVYPYTSSKHSVCVFTEGLRRELRDLKSKIREISPGLVRTEIMQASGMTPEVIKSLEHLLVATILEPRDVSNALLYALTTPPHVQVHEITLYPTGQPEPK